jgi:hypothetical protein
MCPFINVSYNWKRLHGKQHVSYRCVGIKLNFIAGHVFGKEFQFQKNKRCNLLFSVGRKFVTNSEYQTQIP